MSYTTTGILPISWVSEDNTDTYTGHFRILNEVVAILVFEFSAFVVDAWSYVGVGVGAEFYFLKL